MISSLVVTFLGSGTSQGVPLIGCDCPVCRSPDPRDQRTRCSLYIDDGETPFLIDTTPELRLQCLREKVNRVAAVVYTHAHADHVMGLDDLRRFCELTGERLPIYGPEETLAALMRIFPYAFDERMANFNYVRLSPHAVSAPFYLGRLRLTPLPVPHGSMTTFGYLIERDDRKLVAYLSDCAAVPLEIRSQIREVELLIIDGLRDQPHPTHLTSQEAIAIGLDIRAGRTYLTHLTHHKSQVDRERGLPNSCFIAYDGLKISL
jgi:phosphoribosyl 1,2-cyclic phosphate phosphodiesterase